MVTGRVCKNLLGLFSAGVKETLEVKLRLVPVPTLLQDEYVANMEMNRHESVSGMDGFDSAAWSSFLQANPVFPQPPQQMSQPPTPMLEQQGSFQDCNSWNGSQMGQPISRSTTPLQAPLPMTQTRPSSRASVHGRPLMSQAMQPPQSQSYQEEYTSQGEDGPARKRARTMKADWRGPSAFSTANTGDLRVTASTAASIRSHRLSLGGVASTSEFALGDGGMRPPTPRPHSGPVRRSGLTRTSTNLAQELAVNSSDGYISPFVNDGFDGILTSPEKSESASTPQDVPSSPPVMHRPSPTPSSPALPRVSTFADSGFVSGAIDECLTENEDTGISPTNMDVAPSQNQQHQHLLPKSNQSTADQVRQSTEDPNDNITPGLTLTEVMPGNADLLPQHLMPRHKPHIRGTGRRKRRHSQVSAVASQYQDTPAPSSEAPAPREATLSRTYSLPTFQRASSTLPAIPGSEADSGPNPRTSPDLEMSNNVGCETRSSRYNGSSLKRKSAIQERLQKSIVDGKPPPYCKNCGEISTPTWRKFFLQYVDGDPEDRTVEEKTGIIGTETMESDDNGKVTRYRHFKKIVNQKDTDNGFEEIRICNPCGIWLMKWQQMRPPDRWYKGGTAQTVTRPKSRMSKKKRAEMIANGEVPPDSDPAIEAAEAEGSQSEVQQPRPRRPRGGGKLARTSSVSSQVPTTTLQRQQSNMSAALQHAIQSSPPRVVGSRHSPIELDEEKNGRAACRLIFPSPRKAGELKVLDAPSLGAPIIVIDPIKSAPPRTLTPIDPSLIDPELMAISNDKENIAPRSATPNPDDDNDFSHLFESNTDGLPSPFRLPHTPKSGRSQSTQSFCSPTSSARKRQILTPRSWMALNRPNNNDNNRLRTPSPSRNDNAMTLTTEAEMTPFTRHLNQLITEANANGTADQSFDELGMNLGEGFDFDLSQLGEVGGDAFRFSDFSHEGIAGALTGQGCVGSVTGAGSVNGSLDIEFYEDPLPLDGDIKMGGVLTEMAMSVDVSAAAAPIVTGENGAKITDAATQDVVETVAQ